MGPKTLTEHQGVYHSLNTYSGQFYSFTICFNSDEFSFTVGSLCNILVPENVITIVLRMSQAALYLRTVNPGT